MLRLLWLVVIISFVIRFAFSNIVPPELFGDEIDVGYQSYSLLKTGRDLYNQPLPLYIHSLSEWRAPGLIYATVPTVAFLGLNKLAVRLPEIIFGTLGVLIIYILSFTWSKNKYIALSTSLVLCFVPWHILYSRSAFEVVLLLDLVMVAVILFHRKNFILSSIFFALSMYVYSTAIVFTPLLIAIMYLSQKAKPRIIPLCVFVVLLLPLIWSILFGPAKSRFSLISIFSNTEMVSQINSLRQSDPQYPQVWHNKPESLIKNFSDNYFRAFSPEFLFIKGDPTLRHSLGVTGELFPLYGIGLIVGTYFAIKSKQYKVLAWLLIAPVPAALTVDGGYHATRLFVMIPPLMYTIGVGFYKIYKHSKIIMLVLSLCLVGELILTSHYYLIHYPKVSWKWWHVGYEQMVTSVGKNQANYSRTVINNTYEPALIRYLFYSTYDPNLFHRNFKKDVAEKNILPQYDGFTLDNKTFFGSFNETASKSWDSRLLPNTLYIVSQRDDVGGDWDWRTSPPSGIKIIDTITNPYNEPIFYLIARQ